MYFIEISISDNIPFTVPKAIILSDLLNNQINRVKTSVEPGVP